MFRPSISNKGRARKHLLLLGRVSYSQYQPLSELQPVSPRQFLRPSTATAALRGLRSLNARLLPGFNVDGHSECISSGIARTRSYKSLAPVSASVLLGRTAVQTASTTRVFRLMNGRNSHSRAISSGSGSSTAPSSETPGGQRCSSSQQHSSSNDDGREYEHEYDTRNKMAWWLFGCCGMVFGMVALGGITRLTGSGLSMVEWKPTGILPPLSRQGWEAEFEKYKQFPEYQKHNDDLTLDDFRWIWLMEWGHRMFGRTTGIVYGLPLAYFVAKGHVQKVPGLMPKLLALLALGGSQGLIGWWMVKSGLDNKERFGSEGRVSPYRLATHLSMAFLLYIGLFNVGMGLRYGYQASQAVRAAAAAGVSGSSAASASAYASIVKILENPSSQVALFRRGALGVSVLVAITALSGAFVAGNHAGMVYDTFPKMGDEWIPSDYINPYLKPSWRNVFENDTMVQFNHRYLALTTLATVIATFAVSRRIVLPPESRTAVNMLTGMAGIQVSLGISTLLMHVPVPLASAHQMGSLGLLTLSMWLVQTLILRRPMPMPRHLSKTLKVVANAGKKNAGKTAT